MWIYHFIIGAPLIGFLTILGSSVKVRASQFIGCGSVLAASFLSWMALVQIYQTGHSFSIILGEWIILKPFLSVPWSLHFDRLTATMMVMMTTLSFLIHIYSIGYMRQDIPRFMAYLNFFTFAMGLLLLGGNLLQIFVGWEGVGLASYLLIGFKHEKAKAMQAALKAFIVNRIADLAFILAIILCIHQFHTVDITALAALPLVTPAALLNGHYPVCEAIGLLILIAAMGKSAQFGFHIWLPDAMQAPTPVSALIHAATMVTAGIFIIIRLGPIYAHAPHVCALMVGVGGITTLFGATVAWSQNDIKQVIAYSTISQLGYMMMALGASQHGAAFFHLITHAFFKALLFLGAGSVIHAFSQEQDMNKMGGVYRRIPFTYAMMWIGSLALMGVPFFSGYYSKHEIIASLYQKIQTLPAGTMELMAFGYNFALWSAVIGTFLTAAYMTRLMMRVFHGEPRTDSHTWGYLHESPWSMRGVLLIIAIPSLFLGYAKGYFQGVIPSFPGGLPEFFDITLLSLLIGGLLTGYYFSNASLPFPVAPFLKEKWYVETFYHSAITKPFWKIIAVIHYPDELWKKWHHHKMMVSLLHTAQSIGQLQTGYIYHYALITGAGIFFLLLIFI